MSKSIRSLLVASCSLASFAAMAPAYAQDTAAEETAADKNSGDIIVTARRREENLQDIPLAVTAFGGEALREKSIVTQDDLVAHTPSLQIRSNGAQRSDGAFFLRGQGSTFGSQPGVIVYTNEVPNFAVPNFGNNTQFYDLENIQVLKGPQGTLFGRSTTGGAVLLTTKKPTNDLEGFIEGKFGNYSYKELTGALNLPIVEDKVLLRVAGNVVRRKGFTTSLVTGQDLDDKGRESYRISLVLRPVEGFENYTIFRGEHIDENGSGIVLSQHNPNYLTGATTIDPITGNAVFGPAGGRAIYQPNGLASAPFPATLGYNQLVGGLCGLDPRAIPQHTPATFAQCFADRTGRIAALGAALQAEETRVQNGGSIRLNAEAEELYLRGKSQQLTNITTITPGELGPLGDITLKNIFATNRVTRAYSNRAVVGAPNAHATTSNGVDIVNGQVIPSDVFNKRKFFDNFSNEAQIGGSSDYVDWLLGYYYNKFTTPIQMGAIFSTFGDALDASTPLGIGAIQGAFTLNERAIDKGYFGQVTVRPIEQLSVTAGYRKSKYSRTANEAPAVLTAAGLVPGASVAAVPVRQSASSYNFAIDFKPIDDLLVYATHRKGFKPGGANRAVAIAPVGFVPTFSPETVKDYEAGLKYNFDLGGVRGKANLAYYHSDYSNIQRNETLAPANPGDPVVTQVNNIAGAKIDGLELETTFFVGDRFRFGFNYNYTDARYTDFPGVSIVPTENPGISVGGTPFYQTVANINSPYTGVAKHQFGVNARYAFVDNDDIGEVALGGNYYRQSSVNLDDSAIQDPANTGLQGAYGLLNLRLEWNQVMGQNLDLAINATNVTQEVFKVGVANLWAATGQIGSIYGEPRMVSGSIRFRF